MQSDGFNTYQDLAARFGVCVRTVERWFARARKFRPTKRTVRILESDITKYVPSKIKRYGQK